MRSLVTVIGKDKVGIIAKVSSVLAENEVNILDISQTILQEYFTMIMLVDLSKTPMCFDKVKKELDNTGKELGLSIRIQREDIFNEMHNI